MGEIFKVAEIENGEVFGDSFALLGEVIWQSGFMLDSEFANTVKKATDEEIKLFKRAEMYHKHGRKLDELKVGDFVRYKTDGEVYQVDFIEEFVQAIAAGESELYLTLEEAQEAHKKIVGEIVYCEQGLNKFYGEVIVFYTNSVLVEVEGHQRKVVSFKDIRKV